MNNAPVRGSAPRFHLTSGHRLRWLAPWFQRCLTLCLCLTLLAACGSEAANSVTITGSTSVTPFAEHLAELYQKQHPGTVINIQGLGSSAGIRAAIDGVAEIGMSSRELKPD